MTSQVQRLLKDEELLCRICNYVLHEPRILPCRHSFCMKCIKFYMNASDSSYGFHCPVCNFFCDISDPQGRLVWLNNLEKNLFLDQLISSVDILEQELSHRDSSSCIKIRKTEEAMIHLLKIWKSAKTVSEFQMEIEEKKLNVLKKEQKSAHIAIKQMAIDVWNLMKKEAFPNDWNQLTTREQTLIAEVDAVCFTQSCLTEERISQEKEMAKMATENIEKLSRSTDCESIFDSPQFLNDYTQLLDSAKRLLLCGTGPCVKVRFVLDSVPEKRIALGHILVIDEDIIDNCKEFSETQVNKPKKGKLSKQSYIMVGERECESSDSGINEVGSSTAGDYFKEKQMSSSNEEQKVITEKHEGYSKEKDAYVLGLSNVCVEEADGTSSPHKSTKSEELLGPGETKPNTVCLTADGSSVAAGPNQLSEQITLGTSQNSNVPADGTNLFFNNKEKQSVTGEVEDNSERGNTSGEGHDDIVAASTTKLSEEIKLPAFLNPNLTPDGTNEYPNNDQKQTITGTSDDNSERGNSNHEIQESTAEASAAKLSDETKQGDSRNSSYNITTLLPTSYLNLMSDVLSLSPITSCSSSTKLWSNMDEHCAARVHIDLEDPNPGDLELFCVEDSCVVVLVDPHNKSVKSFPDPETCHRLELNHSPVRITKIDERKCAVTFKSATVICLFEVTPALELTRVLHTHRLYHSISYIASRSQFVCCEAKHPKSIDVLNTIGQVVRKIDLPTIEDTLCEPYYLKAMTSGNILICDVILRALICISQSGDVIFSYRPEAILLPVGVCCDENDSVFLADAKESRVIFLSEEGRMLGHVLSQRHGLVEPWAIRFDENSRRFCVIMRRSEFKWFDPTVLNFKQFQKEK